MPFAIRRPWTIPARREEDDRAEERQRRLLDDEMQRWADTRPAPAPPRPPRPEEGPIQIGPPGRDPFRSVLQPTPTPEPALAPRGPTIGPSDLEAAAAAVLPRREARFFDPETVVPESRTSLTLGEAGSFVDPFAVGPSPGEVLEAERREVQRFTRPVLREAGEALGTTIAQQVPGLGLVEPQVRAGVGQAVETVGAELVLPSNLIPIPVIDPAIARALGFAPEAIRAGSRVAPDVLQGIRRRIATLVDDPALGGKARKLVDDIGQLLPSERGAVTPPGGTPREQNFQQFLRERGTPTLDDFDHSLLSPSGRASKVATNRARQRETERLAALGEAQREFRALIDSGEVVDPTGRYTPRIGPGAVEPTGAVPSGEAAQAPPLEPPASSPTGGQLPERGTTGAQQALDLKEETLLRPGRVTQLPGIRQAVSGLNPSVSMDRKVLVSYNARGAVDAALETEFAAQRGSVIDGFEAAWTAQPPTYNGPRNSATDYLNNTAKDFFENPELYTDVSPALRAAVAAYDDISNQFLARFVGDYNGNIRPFTSDKPGWAYLPTVAARETLDESLLKVADGYTSSGLSTRAAVSKPRVYETARERSLKNPKFRAETDLAELSSVHDRALAKMASNETFRLGTGGKTRVEIVEELHPGLRQLRDDAARAVANLKARITTARNQAARQGVIEQRATTKARGVEQRRSPALERIEELGDEWGPELSFLSGQARELDRELRALQSTISRSGGRVTSAELRFGEMHANLQGLERQLDQVRRAYEAANLEPFVLNRSTFRYHEPAQSAAIDSILRTKLNLGDGLLAAVDEVRLIAFAADVSPLTIQGLLGILSDPVTGARSLPGVRRALFSPEELLRITRQEPELVQRYTLATGRPFGQLGTEFVQEARGIERIPSGRRVLERFPAISRIPGAEQVIGAIPGGRELNDSLMSAVELIRYNQWKTDTKIAQLGGSPQNVADAEASNALSKIIPALNPAERGASVLQARAERLPFISTSFIGGPAAAMKDAASGLAKLASSRALSPKARWQELAGREQLAILHLSSIFGSIVTAGVTTHILSGWSPEDALEAVINPKSPRFMSVALGPSRSIPLGGPLRSAARAFIPQQEGEVKGVPIYVPFGGTAQWLKNKVTPALSTPVDLARNKDYWGGKITTGSFPENVLRTLWYAANNILPLTISDPSEAIRRGEIEPSDIGGIAERGGAQFAGIDLRETSPFQQFQRLYQEKYGTSPQEGISPRTLDPDLAREAGYTEETEFGRERSAITAEEEGRLSDLSRSVLQGNPNAMEQFETELGDFFRFRSGVTETLVRDLDLPDREASLVQEFYDLDPRDRRDPETFRPDWDYFEGRRAAILARLRREGPTGREAARALERGAGVTFSDPDLQRAYDARTELRDGLDTYYDTDSGAARERYRRTNPEIDAKLYLLGRVSRVMGRAGQDAVREISQRLLGTEVEAGLGERRRGGGLGEPIRIAPLGPIKIGR